MSQEPASLFVRLPVIYEGPEYLDFVAFGTGGVLGRQPDTQRRR